MKPVFSVHVLKKLEKDVDAAQNRKSQISELDRVVRGLLEKQRLSLPDEWKQRFQRARDSIRADPPAHRAVTPPPRN